MYLFAASTYQSTVQNGVAYARVLGNYGHEHVLANSYFQAAFNLSFVVLLKTVVQHVLWMSSPLKLEIALTIVITIATGVAMTVAAACCREATNPQQVLLGLNFYGNDYVMPSGGRSLPGHEYVEILKTFDPTLTWDKKSKEHMFEYSKDGLHHKVYYPSLTSIQRRLDLAKKYGLGISIWEIGQGLDFFYDLL